MHDEANMWRDEAHMLAQDCLATMITRSQSSLSQPSGPLANSSGLFHNFRSPCATQQVKCWHTQAPCAGGASPSPNELSDESMADDSSSEM